MKMEERMNTMTHQEAMDVFDARPRPTQLALRDDDDLRRDEFGYIIHRQSYGEPNSFGWTVNPTRQVVGNMAGRMPVMGDNKLFS